MTVAPLRITHHVNTRGDAEVWVAPRRGQLGAVPILHFTTPDGRGYAVALSRAELARIRAAAARILDAAPRDVEQWLDQAAAEVRSAAGQNTPALGA